VYIIIKYVLPELHERSPEGVSGLSEDIAKSCFKFLCINHPDFAVGISDPHRTPLEFLCGLNLALYVTNHWPSILSGFSIIGYINAYGRVPTLDDLHVAIVESTIAVIKRRKQFTSYPLDHLRYSAFCAKSNQLIETYSFCLVNASLVSLSYHFFVLGIIFSFGVGYIIRIVIGPRLSLS
jgi:hypothetical protein